MKKTILALALTAAIAPFTFTQTTSQANPPAKSASASKNASKTAKKGHAHHTAKKPVSKSNSTGAGK